MIGRIFNLSPRDRRTALAAGLGAGIGSIFKAPFGGGLLAAEIIYKQDFEIQALVPAFIASVIGYSINASVFGWNPIFSNPTFFFHDPISLIFYGLLGVVCGVIGIVYVRVFYGVDSFFTRLSIPNYIKPAIGGVLVGTIGMVFPYVLGTGYGWIQKLIAMEDGILLSIYFIIAIIFLKILATSLTVGSGGSGGAFAPSLVIGGFTGALIWSVFKALDIPTQTSLAAFVMVGMMAFFGGVGKAPIAAIMMVSEMSGTYSLLVPSMVATVIAYVITGKHTIYASQVTTRRDSPAHSLDYAIPLLTQIRVKDAMTANPISITPETTIEEAMKIMLEHKIRGLPVTVGGKLVGIITYSDLLRAKIEGKHNISVKDIMTKNVIVALPDETLFSAFDKMTEKGIGRLPVVDSLSSMRLVGIITRGDIGKVYEISVQKIIKAKQEELI